MKTIQLTNRIIFVDDIVSIYEENKCGEFQNYTNYYIETKNKRISVNKNDYEKVRYYLLSLNEPIIEELPKEDKKILKLGMTYLKKIDKDVSIAEKFSQAEQAIVDKINELVDKANGE